jgi:hypothetical protein
VGDAPFGEGLSCVGWRQVGDRRELVRGGHESADPKDGVDREFLGLLILPLRCWWQAYLLRYLVSRTRAGNVLFATAISTRQMWGFMVLNYLILLLTLGYAIGLVLTIVPPQGESSVSLTEPVVLISGAVWVLLL